MSDPSPAALKLAEELLPCHWPDLKHNQGGRHELPCPAHYRPSVASALSDLMERVKVLEKALTEGVALAQKVRFRVDDIRGVNMHGLAKALEAARDCDDWALDTIRKNIEARQTLAGKENSDAVS